MIAPNRDIVPLMASENILPGESASQQGSDSFRSSVAMADLASRIWTVDDYCRLVDKVGVAGAREFMQFVQGQYHVVRGCVNVQSAALRSVSSGSSVSRGSSGTRPSSVGTDGSKWSRVMGLSSWRQKFPRGLCYARALRADRVTDVASKLGSWPTLTALLKERADSFVSIDGLSKLSIVPSGDGMCHVDSGDNGFKLLDTLSCLAVSKSYPRGSLGAVVAASGSSAGMAMPGAKFDTVVGGCSEAHAHLAPLRSDFVSMPSSGGTLHRVVLNITLSTTVGRTEAEWQPIVDDMQGLFAWTFMRGAVGNEVCMLLGFFQKTLMTRALQTLNELCIAGKLPGVASFQAVVCSGASRKAVVAAGTGLSQSAILLKCLDGVGHFEPKDFVRDFELDFDMQFGGLTVSRIDVDNERSGSAVYILSFVNRTDAVEFFSSERFLSRVSKFQSDCKYVSVGIYNA